MNTGDGMAGKYSAVFAVTFLLAGLAGAGELPDSQLINEVEAALKMPRGARPLIAYVRYYTVETRDGRREVRGVFLLEPADKPGLHDIDDGGLPMVQDGGCDVVNVRYAIDEKKILGVWCNGVA